MIRNYYLQKKAILFVAPMFLLLLASCGSYQYSGYEDGIYGDSNQQPTSEESSQYANNNQDQNQGNSYYKNLFSEKSDFYGQMADDIVFTDVESYSSADGGDEEIYIEDQQTYAGGRAPWGEDPDQYTINFYNTGFHNGFYNPWRWNRLGYGYGFGGYWNNPFFWDPFFYGSRYWSGGFGPWGGMAFGPGWGWGNGFGYGFGYGGFYGAGHWGRGFVNNPYYGHRNNYRDVAYNSGRRSSYSDYGTNSRDNISGLRNNESSYSRSIRNIRSNDNASRSRSYTRSNADNSNIYSRSNRRSEPARINTSSTRRNSTINRSSNRSSRSNSTYNRSSNSRSSGTVRSSSGSSRSSGTRSSGGGRSSSSRGGGRG